jgi:hypothetical protein
MEKGEEAKRMSYMVKEKKQINTRRLNP